MDEQTRDDRERLGDVTYWPDHFAPMTWARCVASGCTSRVDPWDHSTYCAKHRAPPDHRGDDARARRREVARAIVTANREHAERTDARSTVRGRG